MRIAQVEVEGEPRAAIVVDDHLRILAAEVKVHALLAADLEARERMAGRVEAEHQIGELPLLAPMQPPTIRDFSVFEQHMESGVKYNDPEAQIPEIWYESPFCYFSNPHAVTAAGEEIPVPPGCAELDFELELAAVIGRPGSNLTPSQASGHIAGYTIFNDWSARDLQIKEMRLGLGTCKGKDFANTIGPWIVTADELGPFIDGDRLNLRMHAEVNGRALAGDTSASMAWSFDELVSFASRGTWVRTGDLLGSGTCGGGCLFELWSRQGREASPPPLGPGDVVSLHIEGIGTLTNTVVRGAELTPLPPARAARRL